jgi:hypothetical protein
MNSLTPLAIALITLFLSTSCSAVNAPVPPDDFQSLPAGENAFLVYPQNDSDLAHRKQLLEIIQLSAHKVSPFTYMQYMNYWSTDPSKADKLEEKYELLKYLRAATGRSIDKITKTKIDSGMICWYFYNMGYVFQTATTRIGIDLNFRDAEKLAPLLDLLLVTHAHHDHVGRKLIDSMIALKKPVVTGFYPHTTIVKGDTVLIFGDNRIRIEIGDHHRHLPVLSTNNMLMYQIDYKNNGEKYTIFHSGDGNGIAKMKPDSPVDIFIVHTQLPMPLSKAVYQVRPTITFASHVLELSHSDGFPLPLRWNYDFCYRQIAKVKGYKVITLAWGESWMIPGTKVEAK